MTSTFIRDVQITGDQATGDVYIAGMNEGGGGLPHNDQHNLQVHRRRQHLDQYLHRPQLSRPRVRPAAASYFACMFPMGGYWRHDGLG